jgi:hypothetical protein
MNKILYNLSFILIAFHGTIKCHEFENAIIDNGTIKGSYFYKCFFKHEKIPGKENFFRRPYAALFWGNNGFLGQVKFEQWDDRQQQILDDHIDSTITHEKYTSAKIWFNIKVGREIIFYCDNKSDSCCPYDGPLDIKSCKERPDLIKPHSLLNDIKQVTEDDFFILPYFYEYHSKTLTYNEDGTFHIVSTPQHKMIQTTKLILGLSLLYRVYRVFRPS